MAEDSPTRTPEEDLVPLDDSRIGRAFVWSIVILVALAIAAGGIWYAFLRPPPPPPPVVEAPVAKPKPRAAPAVMPAPAAFVDITQAAGIHFVHTNGAYGERLLPEAMGGGVAFLDFDNDGNQDLLLINSAYWPGHVPPGRVQPTMTLYRNDGHGHYEDVTKRSGLDVPFYGMGVAVGDFDNDGFVDIFVTGVNENHLFKNLGGTGKFRDITLRSGIPVKTGDWSTAAAFFDYDNDGCLDLFVATYVRWSREIDLASGYQLTGLGRAYGPPTSFEGSYSRLYRGRCDGTFTDVSAKSGIQVRNPATGKPMGKALGVIPVDLDGDGRLDLVVANDTVQNFVFHNEGNGTFREIGAEMGVAFDSNGAARSAMGIDAAYYRNDAALGIAIGNFADEMTSLYVSQGKPLQFADEAIVEGVGPASRLALKFGVLFFDYDLDGRLDLLHVNGHLEQEIDKVQASQHYEQPAQIFWNCGKACPTTFIDMPAEARGDLARPIVGRGAAYADIDGDGELDLILTQVGRAPVLLRNDRTGGHHWLRLKLVGGGKVNRDAIGAWAELRAGGITQRRDVMPTRSYLSQVELPLTFGLGNADKIESLVVHWPDGTTQTVAEPKVDALSTITKAP